MPEQPIRKAGPDDCWPWTGETGESGYGIGDPHVLAYEECYGRLRGGRVIYHFCRNYLCCNPEHMQAMTSWAKERNERRFPNARPSPRTLRRLAGRRARLKRKYGLTPKKVAEMLLTQQNRCPICATAIDLDDPRTCIDHCHTSGRVRSILCGPCNSLIGFARESPTILAAAIRYLEQHTFSISL